MYIFRRLRIMAWRGWLAAARARARPLTPPALTWWARGWRHRLAAALVDWLRLLLV